MTKTATAPTGDALIDELNAAINKTPEPKVLDRMGAPPAPLAETLEMKPPTPTGAAPSALVAADKAHAKGVTGGYGYKVWVVGEYYAKSTDTKGNVVKKYRLPFNVPWLQDPKDKKGASALGLIVGKLLKVALQKMDPLAVTFRTHEVDKVEALQGAPEPTSLMYASFESLKKYVGDSLAGFPIDPEEYWDSGHLREDILDFITNQTGEVVFNEGQAGESRVQGGFGVKKTAAQRIQERHAQRVSDRELLAMNE